MKNIMIFMLFAYAIGWFACAPNNEINGVDGSGQVSGDWLIPSDEVLTGAGKDAIPALDDPDLIPVSEVNYLNNFDLLLAYKDGDEVIAYPHPILDWHEIINTSVGDVSFAVTYCPLTGTGIGWNRELENGEETTFGVSGLLYNTNLIPYDRETNSNWSQIRMDCVFGDLQEEQIRTVPLIETTWTTFKAMYPDAMVVSTNTGHDRNYGVYPYNDYRVSPSLIFPINNNDTRLSNPKERVLGVIGINQSVRAYRFLDFDEAEVNVIEDELDGESIVLFGSDQHNFLSAYKSETSDGTQLSFSAVQDREAIVAQDNEGNRWNLFGEAVEGPRTGERLLPTESFIGYWFSWGAFYPDLDIYGM